MQNISWKIFGKMSGKGCVPFVQRIEGWRCESLKKSPSCPRGSSTGGDGVCEDVEGYFSIALMSLRLPSLGEEVTPMRWHRRA